jgi:hypothetical protein
MWDQIVARQRIRIFIVVAVMRYEFTSRVESIQPARRGAHPEHSAPILKKRSDVIAADRVRIFGIVPVLPERIAVIAKEARIRGEPNELPGCTQAPTGHEVRRW